MRPILIKIYKFHNVYAVLSVSCVGFMTAGIPVADGKGESGRRAARR